LPLSEPEISHFVPCFDSFCFNRGFGLSMTFLHPLQKIIDGWLYIYSLFLKFWPVYTLHR
jgi:hypothetical protein